MVSKMEKTERKILLRGLIEVSNQCAKDCRYCGIRRGNRGLRRYHMTIDEVLACADEAVRRGYPAIALQAGELETEANTAFYEEVLRRLPPKLEVTLSLGEQTEEVYRRWQVAAGDRVLRYLLRIESSTPEIYARLHPADCSFERRVECIRTLKRLGYVTGSGVLIGVPGQTKEDLLRDADFFEEMKLDMVGMGPYVPHPASPLAGELSSAEERLQLALWMIREVRRRMPHINMVAATALEALAPGRGRDLGLAAGANVVMPDLTPAKYRLEYDLYPGKSSAT
jgi:biotin synthase